MLSAAMYKQGRNSPALRVERRPPCCDTLVLLCTRGPSKKGSAITGRADCRMSDVSQLWGLCRDLESCMEQLLVVWAAPMQIKRRGSSRNHMVGIQQADVLQHELQEGLVAIHAEQADALQAACATVHGKIRKGEVLRSPYFPISTVWQFVTATACWAGTCTILTQKTCAKTARP